MKNIIILICLFLCGFPTAFGKEEVKFYACVDGDTIKVKIANEIKTVRFLSIDTPESVHPTKEVEYYGKEASEFTCNKVKSASKLELEYDQNSDKEDKYDRLLAWVFVDDYLLQDLIIKGGYGEVAYLYDDYKYTSILEEHQTLVKLNGVGIWDDDARDKFNNKTNDEFEWTFKNVVSLAGIMIGAYFLNIISKKVKKIKKKYKI